MEYKTLSNGVEIPQLGFGVFQIPPEQTKDVVKKAIEVGYRHFDTAQAYFNEAEIGEAIKESGIAREELFLTTKVWVSSYGYEETKKAFQESLDKLGTDYIDLYLLHQCMGDVYSTWRAVEDLYKEGKIKAIGVCNFTQGRFTDLSLNADFPYFSPISTRIGLVNIPSFPSAKGPHASTTAPNSLWKSSVPSC